MPLELGISDAIRDLIGTWLTQEVVDRLWDAFPNRGNMPISNFRRKLQEDKSWARRARRKHSGGHERDYECKQFASGRVVLRVHTDSADRYIKYVTFKIDGKIIGGGVVNVPSVLVGDGKRSGPQTKESTSKATPAVPTPTTPQFKPFTAAELLRLPIELEYDDWIVADLMFSGRM
jgi:hypothetical protein